MVPMIKAFFLDMGSLKDGSRPKTREPMNDPIRSGA